MQQENHALAETANLLGYLGLAPFIAGAGLAWVPAGSFEFLPAHWPLLSYAAIILTFMGAIHWGMAMHADAATPATRMQLVLSIAPSMVAWITLALPTVIGYPVLGLAFLLLLMGDARAVAYDLVPHWYARVRGPLTFGALLALAIAWAGALLAL